MPTISVDTFFACSLMVLLVLSAMATTSKLLYPHINNAVNDNITERYAEVSKYLLLNTGNPSDWGQNCQTIPETFGLAKTDSNSVYDLDVDKVSRLNSENLHAVSYAQIFTVLKMPDVSFRMEIKPIFEVAINLTATLEAENETTYQFEISTEKHGVPIQTELECYAIAENHLETNNATASDGKAYVNTTLSNDVKGPAIFVAFAKAVCNSKIVSFGTYTFAHNSAEPKARDTFLRLSPLNYTLTASYIYAGLNLSKTYALTINHCSNLTQTTSDNQSATYSLPHFLDSSPTILVVTGWNSTTFFTEWTAYPQIPLETGANFADSITLSNVFTNTYTVTINSALYECTVWLGGPRE
jgi:hypothetical protein